MSTKSKYVHSAYPSGMPYNWYNVVKFRELILNEVEIINRPGVAL
jgi:hypothetical protein